MGKLGDIMWRFIYGMGWSEDIARMNIDKVCRLKRLIARGKQRRARNGARNRKGRRTDI